MRLRYRELLRKSVIAADGRKVGRVVDLIAEPRDGRLRVTALLIGRAALVRRIGVKRATLQRVVPPRRIPWALVERVDDQVHLRVASDRLVGLAGDEAAAAGEVLAAERRA